jgi:hypothetical protein
MQGFSMILYLSSLNLSPYFEERTDGGLYVFSNIPRPYMAEMLSLFTTEKFSFLIFKGRKHYNVLSVFINSTSKKGVCVNLHALEGFAGAYWFGFKEE